MSDPKPTTTEAENDETLADGVADELIGRQARWEDALQRVKEASPHLQGRNPEAPPGPYVCPGCGQEVLAEVPCKCGHAWRLEADADEGYTLPLMPPRAMPTLADAVVSRAVEILREDPDALLDREARENLGRLWAPGAPSESARTDDALPKEQPSHSFDALTSYAAECARKRASTTDERFREQFIRAFGGNPCVAEIAHRRARTRAGKAREEDLVAALLDIESLTGQMALATITEDDMKRLREAQANLERVWASGAPSESARTDELAASPEPWRSTVSRLSRAILSDILTSGEIGDGGAGLRQACLDELARRDAVDRPEDACFRSVSTEKREAS
jgi:hypothetical protein